MQIELRIGEWYIIGRGSNQYNKAAFDDVQKIIMVDEKFFQTESHWLREIREEKYTISRYEFTHVPKGKCEKRKRLIEEIYERRIAWRKQYLKFVRQIEAIDDELGIGYHDGKYGEKP